MTKEQLWEKIVENKNIKGRFAENSIPVLIESMEILIKREEEYSDTWELCQWLAMKAIARKYSLLLPQHLARELAAAAFVDIKYSRLAGGFKEDTLIDLVNYITNLVGESREPKS